MLEMAPALPQGGNEAVCTQGCPHCVFSAGKTDGNNLVFPPEATDSVNLLLEQAHKEGVNSTLNIAAKDVAADKMPRLTSSPSVISFLFGNPFDNIDENKIAGRISGMADNVRSTIAECDVSRTALHVGLRVALVGELKWLNPDPVLFAMYGISHLFFDGGFGSFLPELVFSMGENAVDEEIYAKWIDGNGLIYEHLFQERVVIRRLAESMHWNYINKEVGLFERQDRPGSEILTYANFFHPDSPDRDLCLGMVSRYIPINAKPKNLPTPLDKKAGKLVLTFARTFVWVGHSTDHSADLSVRIPYKEWFLFINRAQQGEAPLQDILYDAIEARRKSNSTPT